MPFVLTLSLLAALAEPKVTLRETASVSTLLTEITKSTGTPLFISERRGKEVLIVSMKDVPLSDAMKRIAWATYGIWEKTTDGFRLVEDRDGAKAAERKYLSWQTKEAAGAIASLRRRIEREGVAPDPDPDWLDFEKKYRTGKRAKPVDRALAAALGEVRPETILFTRPDVWCVYATSPTPAQYAFTSGGKAILNAYNSALPPSDEDPAVRAILNVDYRFGVGHARITLYRADGYQKDSSHAVFLPESEGAGKGERELADLIPAEMKVPLSEGSQLVARAAASISFPPTGSEIERFPDLVSRVRNPEKTDPLSTFATDVWRAVADWKHSNLVANIDDVYLFPYWARQTPTLGEAFKTAGGYNAEVQSDWIVARPSLPTPPWLHRIDRTALGRLARTRWTSDFGAMMDRSRFAGAMDVMPDAWTMRMYLAYADAPAPKTSEEWVLPRVVGTMNPEQRQGLMLGRPVPIAELPAASRFALRQAVASTNESNVLIQPTVQFPNGLPDQGVLRVNSTPFTGYCVVWKGEGGVEPIHVLDFFIGTFLQNLEQRQPMDFRTLSLRRCIGPEVKFTAEMGKAGGLDLGSFFDIGSENNAFVPWDSLSDDARKRLMSSDRMP